MDEVNQSNSPTGVQIDHSQLVEWYRKELNATSYRLSQAEAGVDTLIAQRQSLLLRVQGLEQEKADVDRQLNEIRAEVEELKNGGLEDVAAEEGSDEWPEE